MGGRETKKSALQRCSEVSFSPQPAAARAWRLTSVTPRLRAVFSNFSSWLRGDEEERRRRDLEPIGRGRQKEEKEDTAQETRPKRSRDVRFFPHPAAASAWRLASVTPSFSAAFLFCSACRGEEGTGSGALKKVLTGKVQPCQVPATRSLRQRLETGVREVKQVFQAQYAHAVQAFRQQNLHLVVIQGTHVVEAAPKLQHLECCAVLPIQQDLPQAQAPLLRHAPQGFHAVLAGMVHKVACHEVVPHRPQGQLRRAEARMEMEANKQTLTMQEEERRG